MCYVRWRQNFQHEKASQAKKEALTKFTPKMVDKPINLMFGKKHQNDFEFVF